MATLTLSGLSASSGGGGSASQYLSVADGTEIGSSGKVADGASNAIELSVDNGQVAAVAANGLSSLIGGVWWNLGDTPKGNISTHLEPVSIPDNCHIVVAVWRDTSDPTAIQDIEDATAHWLQVLAHGGGNSGNLSTQRKTGSQALATALNENRSGTTGISFSVGAGPAGFGGALSRHENSSGVNAYENATEVTAASGDFYIALLFGKLATAGSDETISVKLSGGSLQ